MLNILSTTRNIPKLSFLFTLSNYQWNDELFKQFQFTLTVIELPPCFYLANEISGKNVKRGYEPYLTLSFSLLIFCVANIKFKVWAFLELLWVQQPLAPFHNQTTKPLLSSTHPDDITSRFRYVLVNSLTYEHTALRCPAGTPQTRQSGSWSAAPSTAGGLAAATGGRRRFQRGRCCGQNRNVLYDKAATLCMLKLLRGTQQWI